MAKLQNDTDGLTARIKKKPEALRSSLISKMDIEPCGKTQEVVDRTEPAFETYSIILACRRIHLIVGHVPRTHKIYLVVGNIVPRSQQNSFNCW
jgi:hypothetical protein